MSFLPPDTAREYMNSLGTANVPFLFILNYSLSHCLVLPLTKIRPEMLLYSFPAADNLPKQQPSSAAFRWSPGPLSKSDYQHSFDIVQHHLHAGNTFLTNLTCSIPVTTNLTLRDICLRAQAPYRLWLKDHFVCFSPEPFIRIDTDGQIHSYPMKGTRPADTPNAEAALMADPKEAAEHATVVDLIRNDLSSVANNVQVLRYRYAETLQTHRGRLIETSSEITGTLPANTRHRLGDILFAQLPAGSITGAPKPKTLEIIREAESHDRGFYTGVMGIFADGTLDSAVMIRFVEQHPDGSYVFKAGGGITAQSRCEDEYREILEKAYVPIH